MEVLQCILSVSRKGQTTCSYTYTASTLGEKWADAQLGQNSSWTEKDFTWVVGPYLWYGKRPRRRWGGSLPGAGLGRSWLSSSEAAAVAAGWAAEWRASGWRGIPPSPQPVWDCCTTSTLHTPASPVMSRTKKQSGIKVQMDIFLLYKFSESCWNVPLLWNSLRNQGNSHDNRKN